MTTPTTLRLPDDQIAALDDLAELLQISRSEVIRRALLEGVLVLRRKAAEAYGEATP